MPKLTLTTLGSRYGSVDALNANFDAIEQALENTLSRDGSAPNFMETDLDMNNNSILNVSEMVVGGVNISSINSALVWRGAWNSATAYAVSDAVEYNGTSYIAITSNTNSAPPSASWNVLAAKGASGAGAGDVTGPASSVNGRIAVFSGTSGKTIADGGIDVAGLVADSDIGVSVQAYDANTAKTNLGQQWTAAPYTQPLTDNDLSFDISAKLDFVCTPTAGGTLTFTNIRAGAKGDILFVNNSNYAIAKAATVKASSSFLTTISATGRYIISYRSLDGTNVDVVASAALS